MAPYTVRANATAPAMQPEATRVPYAPDAPRGAVVLTPGQRSFALDRDADAMLRVPDGPTYQLFVEGEGEHDGGHEPPRTAEQRVARVLNATKPPSIFRFGGAALDTTPCMSLASIGTPFGPAYNPNGFCP